MTPAVDNKELAVIKGQATKAKNLVTGLVIENDEQYAVAKRKRGDLNEIKKDLEKRKRKITDPMNEALKEVRNLFRPAEGQVVEAIGLMDNTLRAYDRKKAEEARIKEQELQAQIASGEKEVSEAITEMAEVQSKPEVYTKSGAKVSDRKIQKLEVFDPTLVPREYLVVDNVAVRQALIAGKQVPGARMVEETIYA